MISAVWFVVAASIGIDVGWQPVEDGGYEFLLQIEPEQLERLKAGEALTSDLPALPGRVVRVHWLVGNDSLPQTTLPAASPQDATPSNAAAAAETPPAESPTTADTSREATTANRPIAPAVPGELSLTDGRSATNVGARGAESLGESSATTDAAVEQPELALATPRSSEAAVAADTGDAWHSVAPSTSQEPAPVAAASYEQLAGVGPVDPGETNVDLSDGLDDTPASVAPRLDKQPEDYSGASTWGNSASSAESAAAALEHRARPNTSATATDGATATDIRHEKSTAITGASGTDEPPASDEVVATSSPRPLAWLAAITTLGASLAGNVFFFWGFVDAKRRYRTALRDSGLLPA